MDTPEQHSAYERLKGRRQSWWRVIVPAAVALGILAALLPFVGVAFTPIVCLGGALLPLLIAVTAATTTVADLARADLAAESPLPVEPAGSAWDFVRAALFKYRVWLVIVPAAAPGMFLDLLRVLLTVMVRSDGGPALVSADYVRQAAWMVWPGLGLPGNALLAAALATTLVPLLERRNLASGIAVALMATYLFVSLQTLLVALGTGAGLALNIGEIIVFVLVLVLPYGLAFLALRLARR
jgi:hypothetical protein